MLSEVDAACILGTRIGGPLCASFGVKKRLEPDGPVLVLEYGGPEYDPIVVRMQAGVPPANRRTRTRVIAVIPSWMENN